MKDSRVWFIAVALAFLVKQAFYLPSYGDFGFNDTTSEQLTYHATQSFVRDGLAASAGLPVYHFVTESPMQAELLKTGIYTHFLPGPEYALWCWTKLAGSAKSGLWLARLFTTLLTFGATLLFAHAAGRALFPNVAWAQSLIAGAIFFAPGIYAWAPTIYGNIHSSVAILLSLTLAVRCLEEAGPMARKSWRWAFLAAIAIGFYSNEMLLEGAFAVFFAPLVLLLMFEPSPERTRRARGLALALGLGLIAAFVIHLFQVAAVLNSFANACLDQFGTFITRSENRGGTRLQIIGNFSQHAGGQFRVSALNMLVFGSCFIALWHAPKAHKARWIGALFLSCVAGYLFPFVLKGHSEVHYWRVPRAFLIEFAVFLLVIVESFKNYRDTRGRMKAY